MPIKDYKAKDITIAIRPAAEKPAGPAKKKGAAFPSKGRIYPGRRISDEDGIFIRLFDVGDDGSGTIDFAFNNPPVLSVDIPSGAFSFSAGVDYAAAFNDWFFAQDRTNFVEVVPPVHPYNLHVNGVGDGGYDADRGFATPGGGVACQNLSFSFRAFDTESPQFKVTNDPSYSADEVDFYLDEDADVYLMPVIAGWSGIAETTKVSGGSTNNRYAYYLNGFRKALPRTYFLDDPAWIAEFGDNPFNIGYFQILSVASVPRGPAVRSSFWSMATGDADAFLYKVDCFISFFFRNYSSHTTPAPSTFPTLATPDIIDIPNGTPATYKPLISIRDISVPVGLLCAAIKKGDDWFYVWNKFLSSQFSAGGDGFRLFV